jgi:hypothetical protein
VGRLDASVHWMPWGRTTAESKGALRPCLCLGNNHPAVTKKEGNSSHTHYRVSIENQF